MEPGIKVGVWVPVPGNCNQGQTAVPGGKTGDNEKAKPKNLKKPEGNNGNNAAPVKNEKEQRNQSTQPS